MARRPSRGAASGSNRTSGTSAGETRVAATLRIVAPADNRVASFASTEPTRETETNTGPKGTDGSKPTHKVKATEKRKAIEDQMNKLSIADLTLDTPLRPFNPKPRRVPTKPFPFLLIPSELRIKIYDYYFEDIDKNEVLDLAPGNHKRIHKALGLMRVCKQVHAEATYYFYSTRTFRIFPTYPGKFFKSKRPLLARLKPHQRRCITSLQLRLGPGWNAPPRGWVVNPALGLEDCVNVRTLDVFVEFDPSDSAIKGFRRSDGFYEAFSCDLMEGVVDALPGVKAIQFDGWSSVKKSGNMMRALLEVAGRRGHGIGWGPERGWTDEDEDAFTAQNDAVAVEERRRVEALLRQGVAPHLIALS